MTQQRRAKDPEVRHPVPSGRHFCQVEGLTSLSVCHLTRMPKICRQHARTPAQARLLLWSPPEARGQCCR